MTSNEPTEPQKPGVGLEEEIIMQQFLASGLSLPQWLLKLKKAVVRQSLRQNGQSPSRAAKQLKWEQQNLIPFISRHDDLFAERSPVFKRQRKPPKKTTP